jgi:hypothetical protein
MAGRADGQIGAGRGQSEALPDHLRFSRVAGTSAAETFVEALEAPDIVKVDAGAGKIAGKPEILAVGLLGLLDRPCSSASAPSAWRMGDHPQGSS